MKRTAGFMSLLLVILLLLSLLSAAFAAESETPAGTELTVEEITEQIPRPELILSDDGLTVAHSPRSSSKAKTRSEPLPASYTSAYITPVRNQGAYGTCWAHAAIACVEANILKKGLTVEGATANTSTLNLSESQLAWFTYSDACDALGMLRGDQCSVADYRLRGGGGQASTMTLMRWTGPASESVDALAYANIPDPAVGLSPQYAYAADVAHVQDAFWIPSTDQNAVKQAIMDYGAGTISYCSDAAYEDRVTGATYCCDADKGTNHDVTLIGWNDSYSRANFNTQPPGDGAWLVKNSWGNYNTLGGYFYLSYYDLSIGSYCFFYNVEEFGNYDSNYQYDGTSNAGAALGLVSGLSFGNVFTANGTELLEAVSVCHSSPDFSYTLQIYVDVQNMPGSGRLVTSQDGILPYAGYQTVRLNAPVQLTAGQKFAVVFTAQTDVDALVDFTSGCYTHQTRGCSYLGLGTFWQQSDYDFRIKAYTTGNTPSCLHANTEIRDAVPATCTGAGYSGDVYCLDCGEPVYSGAPTQPTGHSFSGVTCTQCGQKMGFSSVALRLGENIDLLYTVTVPDGFDDVWLEFTFNGKVTEAESFTALGNRQYLFIFPDISPQCMGDNVSTRLCIQYGRYVWSLTNTYSIRQYCTSKLSDRTLRTLLSDLLTYGAAAQVYMDHNADAPVTKNLSSYYTPSTFPGLSGYAAAFTGTQDESTYWTNASLVLKNDVAARFGFVTDDVSGLTVQVSIDGRTTTYTAADFGTENGMYFITFDGIKATEFDDTVTATFYRDGVQVGNTVNYSVNAYICAKQNDADAALQALVRALYNYGAAAKAYSETLVSGQ